MRTASARPAPAALGRIRTGDARPCTPVSRLPSQLAAVESGQWSDRRLVLKRGMPVGIAYGIWAAAGVALVALIGAVFLPDGLAPIQIGLVLVAVGVMALELGAQH